MKKFILLITCCILIFACQTSVLSQGEVVATPTNSKVLIDGKGIAFQSYNINGYNYFKVRDLAAAFVGTRQQFIPSLSYGLYSESVVYLYKTYGECNKYQPTGNELETGDGKMKNAIYNETYACADKFRAKAIMSDSLLQKVESYSIDDYTYAKLRDIARIFDFSLKWNEAENQIEINTEASYLSSVYIPPKHTDIPTAIGQVRESDKMMFINEMPIMSYEIERYDSKQAADYNLIYIIAEDLGNYGFDISWDNSTKTLSLAYNESKKFGMMDGETVNSVRNQNKLSTLYSDNTHVLLDGNEVDAYSLDGKMLIPASNLYPYGIFSYGLDPDTTKNSIKYRVNIDFLKLKLQKDFEAIPKEDFQSDTLKGYSDSEKYKCLNAGDNRYGTVYYQSANSMLNGMVSFGLRCSEYDPVKFYYLGYFENDQMNGIGLFTKLYYEAPGMYAPREKNTFERGIYQNGILYDGIAYTSGAMLGATPDGQGEGALDGNRTEGAFVNGYQRRCIVEENPQTMFRFGYRIQCEGEVQNGEFCGYYRQYDEDGKLVFEGLYSDYIKMQNN